MFRRLRIGDSWLCTRAGRAGRRSIPRQQLPIERDVTSDDRVVLTTRGRLLSNELFSRLV